MGLLKPRRKGRPLPLYRTLSCPVNGHQVGWCRQLCTPVAGVGLCGRPAPHSLMGRTQLAIAAHKAARGGD